MCVIKIGKLFISEKGEVIFMVLYTSF